MQLIDKITQSIRWNQSLEEQLSNLTQFDHLSEEEISLLTQYHKRPEVGILIEYLGFKKLRKYLPQFLTFLMDMNWPASGGAARMLISAREEIIPEIKRVFKEVDNDSFWHYWILLSIIDHWEPALVKALIPELKILIQRVDEDGASIQALRILQEKGLILKEEIKTYYQYLYAQYEGNEAYLKDLKEEIKL